MHVIDTSITYLLAFFLRKRLFKLKFYVELLSIYSVDEVIRGWGEGGWGEFHQGKRVKGKGMEIKSYLNT
jgi:hypothetical protein